MFRLVPVDFITYSNSIDAYRINSDRKHRSRIDSNKRKREMGTLYGLYQSLSGRRIWIGSPAISAFSFATYAEPRVGARRREHVFDHQHIVAWLRMRMLWWGVHQPVLI